MTRVKWAGFIAIAALALGIATVSPANAAELKNLPEKVTFTFKSSGSLRLETLGGKGVDCTSLTGHGEFTSERLGIAEFKFTECKEPSIGITCTGLSDTTGNVTVAASFHTRHLLPASEGVDVATLISSVHFSCLGVLFTDSGCQASMDLLTTSGGENIVGKLRSSVFIDYLQERGDQKPTSIDTDNGLAMEVCELITKQESGTGESSGLLDSGTIEKFEVNGKSATELVDLTGTP